MRFLLSSILVLSACTKKPTDTAGKLDSTILVTAAFDAGSQLSALTGSLSAQSGDYVGCLVGKALSSALATASDGIRGKIDGYVLPGVEVDVSECLELGESVVGLDVSPVVEASISIGLTTAESALAIYAGQIECDPWSWSQAGIIYAKQLVPVIISEISNPDGVLFIDEVEVAECD